MGDEDDMTPEKTPPPAAAEPAVALAVAPLLLLLLLRAWRLNALLTCLRSLPHWCVRE